MPYLIRRNSSVVLKRLETRNCDSGIWMWYRGEMQQASPGFGPCVIYHFGGGGTSLSRNFKAEEWKRAKTFFGGYHESGDYGYGVAQRLKIGTFSFVFTFAENNEFVIVNTTSPENFDIQRYTQKFMKQFRGIAARFHIPNSQCSIVDNITAPVAVT